MSIVDFAHDTRNLRYAALSAKRKANALPLDDPERATLARLADQLDDMADQIDALSPEMRADLEIMVASLRPH